MKNVFLSANLYIGVNSVQGLHHQVLSPVLQAVPMGQYLVDQAHLHLEVIQVHRKEVLVLVHQVPQFLVVNHPHFPHQV